MKLRFEHVAVIGKYASAGVASATLPNRVALEQVARHLDALGCDVCIESDSGQAAGLHDFALLDVDQIGSQCDLAVVVGGDGTMLGFGRQLAPFGVPLIGINQGRLGFITDIACNAFADVLGHMLQGHYVEDQRHLIDARVLRDGHCVFKATAMNDVVVNRGNAASMVELRVEVDGRFVANQRADGLIIASPTGSTAYALSAGGPMLHPDIAGWVIVPIAPHTLSNRPIVLPDSARIAIEIVAGRDASASFDMQSLASLLHGDRIEVQRSAHQVRFLHPLGWSYFDTLRAKLHWNEGGTAT